MGKAKQSDARQQVVIANRLADGLVVFLGSSGWVETIDRALVARSQSEAEALEARGKASEARQEVVDPYCIDVREEGSTLVPDRYREAIRARGPTVRTDLGKQAGN